MTQFCTCTNVLFSNFVLFILHVFMPQVCFVGVCGDLPSRHLYLVLHAILSHLTHVAYLIVAVDLLHMKFVYYS